MRSIPWIRRLTATRQSVDGVPDYFKAMADGDANATVELNPHLGGPAFDVVGKVLDGDKAIPKLIRTTGGLFTQDTAAAEYEKRRLN